MDRINTKPKLAVISSFNEDCANASFATTLCESLASKFNVETFDLKSQSLMFRTGRPSIEAAEKHIDGICQRLKEFDLVNIHCELGLFGHSLEQIYRRMIKLLNSSKRVIFTMHRLDLQGGRYSNDDHAHVYAKLLTALTQRAEKNSYHVIVHLPREKELIQEVFGIENITDYPVLHLSSEKRKYYQENANSKAWKKAIGFAEDDIVIGRFGFLATYKDHLLGLKLLTTLPDNYKLAFIGGQHPATLQHFAVDPVVKDIVDFLDTHKEIRNRVAFLGHTDDPTFYTAMSNIDFVLVPHYEVGQSASAVTSMALELNRPIVVSYAFNFLEYNRYYPNCFEMFDIGNYYAARDKILHFDYSKVDNLKRCSQNYTLEKLAGVYQDIYNKMENSPIEVSTYLEELKTLADSNIAKPGDILGYSYADSADSSSNQAKRLIRRIYATLPENVKKPLRYIKQTINQY